MITDEQYKVLRERIDIESAWWGRPKEDDEKLMPEDMRVSNADKSAVEVYEFVNDPPEKYIVYINTRECTATTWAGDVLGTVTFGKEYRSNFGDKRQHVRMKGINGKIYTGTYYKSAGDYARIRATKTEKGLRHSMQRSQ